MSGAATQNAVSAMGKAAFTDFFETSTGGMILGTVGGALGLAATTLAKLFKKTPNQNAELARAGRNGKAQWSSSISIRGRYAFLPVSHSDVLTAQYYDLATWSNITDSGRRAVVWTVRGIFICR